MPLILKHTLITAPLWITTGWLLSSDLAHAAGPDSSFNLTQPAPGIFVHLGRQVAAEADWGHDIANIGFIVGRSCIAVIDTGGSAQVGLALRAAIRQHSAVP